jgi:NADPH2:quinone reductase
MRALICTEYGDPPKLARREVPSPSPAEGELLLNIEAVGLGYFDNVLLSGRYQEKPPLPLILGRECSGTVMAIGASVDPNLIGQRVAAISFAGCMAEQAVVKISDAMSLPHGMSAAKAASCLSAYATMLYALTDCADINTDDAVLVLGAAGTVGQAAIDVALALGGRVIAAASSPEKRSAALARGAEIAIDYTTDSWRTELKRIVPGGIDIVVDPVGGSFSEMAFRQLAPRGRHLVVGFTAGVIPCLPLNLPLLKRASLVGVNWGGFARCEPEANAALLNRLHKMLANGKLTPPNLKLTVSIRYMLC